MSVSKKCSPAWRGLGLAGVLVMLSGCAAPREAATPSPGIVAPAPVATLERVATLDSRLASRMYTPASYASASASVHALPAELLAAWRQSGLAEDSLSLVVAEVGQNPLIAINPGQPRNPASVMKLITTYAALEGLGPTHTWRTDMLTAANALPRPDGTLPGPLYIRASGDPEMAVEDLWRMLRALRLRGIRSLPGVVVDRSVFGPVSIDPGEFDDTPDRVYNASPDALVVGFGALGIVHVPDELSGTWRIHLDPPMPGVRIDNQVKASTARCPGPPAVRTQQIADATGLTLKLAGTVALSCGEFSLHRLAFTQPEHAARMFQQMWSELGGQLTGPIVNGLVPPGAVKLATHESAPLGDMIRTINKLSNNIMARMMLLALGEQFGQPPATTQKGAAALGRVLADQGLVFPELVIENGSGLSRDGRVSAGSLASMLNVAWMSPRMPEFVSSMAIAGEDGTVKRRWKSNGTRGRAHLKTGTLRDTSALAGYVQGTSGKRYVLVSMVNDPKAFNVKAFNDALVEWLSTR